MILKKTYQNKVLSYFLFMVAYTVFAGGIPPIWVFFLVGVAQYVSRLKWG